MRSGIDQYQYLRPGIHQYQYQYQTCSMPIPRFRGIDIPEYNFDVSKQKGFQNVPDDALSRLATIQPCCKTLHEIYAHPGVTRLYEYIQRHKVPISLDETKRVIENCKTCALWKPHYLRPPGSSPIRSSKPWERHSIDIVGPKPMTRSKNQYLRTVVDEFSRFPFAFFSKTSRLVASTNVY